MSTQSHIDKVELRTNLLSYPSHVGSPKIESVDLSSFKRKKFNLSKHEDEERPLLARLALHASSIQCKDLDGHDLSITAKLSKDLDATLKQLAKWGS